MAFAGLQPQERASAVATGMGSDSNPEPLPVLASWRLGGFQLWENSSGKHPGWGERLAVESYSRY